MTTRKSIVILSHHLLIKSSEGMSVERLTFDELIVAEAWLTDKSGDEDRAMEIINKAISHLRHLMKQDLSKAELVRYLRQQMGIEPKSEKLKDPLPANQSPGSAIFRR